MSPVGLDPLYGIGKAQHFLLLLGDPSQITLDSGETRGWPPQNCLLVY